MRPNVRRTRIAKHKKPTSTSKVSFTEAGLRNAEPSISDYTINDPKTAGLSLKITPLGRKVFIYRYRTEYGLQRKFTVGQFEVLTVAEARRRVKLLAAEVSEGGDPSVKKRSKRHAITVAQFADRYLTDQAKPKLAASTYKEYARVLHSKVVPTLGNKAMIEVRRADIEKLHASMSNAPVRANRMLSVVKAMFFKAEDWEIIPRGSNPASRVKMNKESPKQRYFNKLEQIQIFNAIEKLRPTMPKSLAGFDAIIMLFYTGCRPGEVLKLRWEDIDLDAGVALLHETKTGEARLLLATAAVDFLQSIATVPHEGWVFAGAIPGQPLKSLKRPWLRICEEANLPGACIKDIRHTVGTFIAQEGGLFAAQAILRHTSPKTTMRYAHPVEASIRSDLENAVGHIHANRIAIKNAPKDNNF